MPTDKPKVRVTEMQKRAVDEILVQKLSGGNINYGKALAKAGYSKCVQEKPKDVVESKGFIAELNKYDINEPRVAALLSEEINARGAGERLDVIKFVAQLMGLTEAKVSISMQQSDVGVNMLRQIIEADATRPEQDIPSV